MTGNDLEFRGVLYPGVPGDAHVLELRAYGVAAAAGFGVYLDAVEFFAAGANGVIYNSFFIPQKAFLETGAVLEARVLALGVGASFAPAAAVATKFLTWHAERVAVDLNNSGAFVSVRDARFSDQFNPLRPAYTGENQVAPNAGDVVLPRASPHWNPSVGIVAFDEAIRIRVTTQAGGAAAAGAHVQAVAIVACYAKSQGTDA